MIESGFDILNPVQLTARGMDARKLKAEYGDRLVFWGGWNRHPIDIAVWATR